MTRTKNIAVLGALSLALSGPVVGPIRRQLFWWANGGGAGASEVSGHAGATVALTEGGTAASGSMGMSKKGTHGMTLHKQNKAMHARGAAASATGTNDKGSPQ
ncbi:MAG: hypothetical protein CBARDCOR_2919 [uncultured Caballeronia sp.]|nr:MAG: hypothetical protein CBARDCOR_2919 [uncultured Caballeronia sp.]